MKNTKNGQSWTSYEITPIIWLVLAGYSNQQITENFKMLLPGRSIDAIGWQTIVVRRVLRENTTSIDKVRQINDKLTDLYMKIVGQGLPRDLCVILPSHNKSISPKFSNLITSQDIEKGKDKTVLRFTFMEEAIVRENIKKPMEQEELNIHHKKWQYHEIAAITWLVYGGYTAAQIKENFMSLLPGRTTDALGDKVVNIRKAVRPETTNVSQKPTKASSELVKTCKKILKQSPSEDLLKLIENVKPHYNSLINIVNTSSDNSTKIPASYNEPTIDNIKEFTFTQKPGESMLQKIADTTWRSATFAPITLTTKKQNKINRILTMLEAMEGDIEVNISSLDEKLSIKINSDD